MTDDDRQHYSRAGWAKSVLADRGYSVDEDDDDVVERQKRDGARGHDSEGFAGRAPHTQEYADGCQGCDGSENE